MDINRLRPVIGASMLSRHPGDTIRERGFNEDDFALADLGSSIDEQLTTIGQKVKTALRNGQITASELGVEHLFVQEAITPVSMGTSGQAQVLAKLDFGFATTINGKPYVFAPDTKTKGNLNDRSHFNQLYAQGKSLATHFQQESARQNAPANITRYANATVSIVQNNLLRTTDASGNLTISAKAMVNAAVQRANNEPNEAARLRIYAQLIKQLVIDPSIQAERGQSSVVQSGGQTISQANRLNYYDPQAVSHANAAADYWHLRGRAIQRITGIADPRLVDRLRDTAGMVRKDFFTQEEYDAYRKSRTLMDSWSHRIADVESKGGTVSQAEIDGYSAELRRTLTLKNGNPLAFLPDMKGRQVVSHSGVYPSSLGSIDVNEGWAKIPGTQMYVNRDRVRIASSKYDAMGKPMTAAEFNYAPGVSGSHVINGRLVAGGMSELNAIAQKADQVWTQQTGGQQGTYAAVDAVRKMLNKKVVAALPGSATETWQYKYGTALPDDPNATKTAIQVRVQNMINNGVFPGIYDEEGITADLMKLMPAVPGMAVFSNAAGQPVVRSGRSGKYTKDIQKAARNYTLRYGGQIATMQSPLMAQGADHPEAVTVFNRVLLSNLEEFSTLRRDLADKFVGTTPYKERIPISSNPNFIPATPDQVKFGRDASGRNGLMIGWNVQPDGTRKEHYYRVSNWDNITDIQARLVERKDGKHFVIDGTAHQGVLSGGTKSWDQKAVWVAGETGAAPDVEASAYYNAGNPILTAVALTNGMYANRADMIAVDILKMVRSRPEVRELLAKRNGISPDQVEQNLSIDMKDTGPTGQFITGGSRLSHDAWMLLVDQKASELTGIQTVSKTMSKQRFEALRTSLGVSRSADQMGVVLPDRFSDTGGDSWAFRDEKGNAVISDQDMHKVDVRVRAYVGPMADIFTTTWQWGRGRMSMEEIQDIIQNPIGYSPEVKEAMVNQFMPQALRSGGRSRMGASNVVKAYLASAIPNADLHGLGINVIDFSELQAAMGEDVATDFYSQINDPSNKFAGKFIRLPNGKIAPPLRTHYSMSTFREGAKANYKNKMGGRSMGRAEQLNRIPELMRRMLSGQVDSSDFPDLEKAYTDTLYDLATSRGTLKNALSTRYGIEGVYVMDPNLPFNAMVIDDDTATRLYGTTNRDEIAKKARYAFGLRRPDSSSGLTGMMAFKVLSPEEAGRDPRQKGQFISNFVADVLQGDTDGDRMAAFAANVMRTGEPFAGMEDAVSSAGFLKRVGYGFSTILGTDIKFKTLNEYQQFVYGLKKAGIGSTELGKSNVNLSEDMMGSSPVRGTIAGGKDLFSALRSIKTTDPTEWFTSVRSAISSFPKFGSGFNNLKLDVIDDDSTLLKENSAAHADLNAGIIRVRRGDLSGKFGHQIVSHEMGHMIDRFMNSFAGKNWKTDIVKDPFSIGYNNQSVGDSYAQLGYKTPGSIRQEFIADALVYLTTGINNRNGVDFSSSEISPIIEKLRNTVIDTIGLNGPRGETLEEMLARVNNEVLMADVSKGTMQTEAIGHREMQLGYDLFKRDLPAVLSKLGANPGKQHEQRTRYHIYQKAVDKIIFSSGLRESIGLMKGYNFGAGISRDQLNPDLGEQPWRQVNLKEGGGSASFLRSVIRGVLKTNEFRASGSNVSWISDVAKAISGDSTDQKMIAAIIASDPSLKEEIAKTEGMGGGMGGVLARAQYYQAAGGQNLDKLMEQTADDLSRRISKTVFGDSLRSAAQGKGTIMSLALAMATEATRRATTYGGEIGTKATSSLFDLRTELGDELLNEYLSAGEYANAEQTIASGRAGKNLAANVMVLGDKLTNQRFAFARLLGTRAIREAKRQKDQTKKAYFKAVDGVGDDREVKINRFEEKLLAELQTSDLPTSEWIKLVRDVGQEMKVNSGQMPLYDRALEAVSGRKSAFLHGADSKLDDLVGRLAGDFDTKVSDLSPALQGLLAKSVSGAFNAALRLTKGDSGNLTAASKSVASARQIAFSDLIPDDMQGVSPAAMFMGSLKGNFAMPKQASGGAPAMGPTAPQADADKNGVWIEVHKQNPDGTTSPVSKRFVSDRKSAQDKFGTSIDALRTPEGKAFFGQYTSGQRPMAELHAAIDGAGVTIGGNALSIKGPFVKALEAASSGKQSRVGTVRQGLDDKGMYDASKALFDLTDAAQSVKEFGKALKFATATSKDFGDGQKTNAEIMQENIAMGRSAIKSGQGMTQEDKVQLDASLKAISPIIKHMRDTGLQIGGLPQGVQGAVQAAMEWESAAPEAGIFGNRARVQPAGGGVGGKMIRGLTSGSLGELGWTMMNAKRLWGMSGGAVSGRVEEYAKYSAEQQSAMAGLGLIDQYSGAGSNIIQQRNSLTDFERANQRAAWNTFQAPFNAISQIFGGSNPDRPGFLNYAVNNAGLGIGLPIAAGFGGSIAQMAGMGMSSGAAVPGAISKLLGGTGTGLAGALTAGASRFLLPAAGIGLAVSAAQAMGEPLREGQNWGMAVTEKVTDASGYQRSQFEMDRIAEVKRKYGGGRLGISVDQQSAFDTDISAARKQAEQDYRTWKEGQWFYGSKDENFSIGDTVAERSGNKVGRDVAANIASMVSKTVGLSADQLKSDQGLKFIEMLGMYPDQQGMQTRYDLGQQIARLGGAKYGSDQFMSTITKVMGSNFSNTDVLNAQVAAQQLSPLGDMGRSLGANTSWLNNPELLANMTASQRLRYSKLGSGDRRAWSSVGRSMGLNELITMEADSNLALGTLTTGELSSAARIQGLTARGYSSSEAAGMPLQSLASIEFQQRQQRNTQQAFSVAQQQRGMAMNQAQAFGGMFTQGNGQMAYNGSQLTQGTSAYNFAGSFNIQQQQANLGFSGAMANLALSGGTLGGGYGWRGMNLGQLQGQSLTSLGTAGLNYRQSLEAMEIQRKYSGVDRGYAAQDAWTSFNRGNTQLDWSQQDLTTNFGRSMQQLSYSIADMATNFSRSQTQSGWQKESIQLQANRSSLQFGWGNEDIDEAMRFATGRDRRKLARQRERGTIEYGMNVDQTNRELEHLQERSKWTEEDYNKELGRTQERRRWMEDDFNKELGRIEVRRGWLDEDLARALGRIGAQASQEDELFQKKLKDMQDELELAAKGHANSMAQTKASYALQQQSIDDAIASFKLEAENQKIVLENNQKNWELTTQLSDNYANITSVMQASLDTFSYNFGNAEGPVVKALESFKDEWLKATDQIIKNLWQKVSGSVAGAASSISGMNDGTY